MQILIKQLPQKILQTVPQTYYATNYIERQQKIATIKNVLRYENKQYIIVKSI